MNIQAAKFHVNGTYTSWKVGLPWCVKKHTQIKTAEEGIVNLCGSATEGGDLRRGLKSIVIRICACTTD